MKTNLLTFVATLLISGVAEAIKNDGPAVVFITA
jgi:hypothetical protein